MASIIDAIIRAESGGNPRAVSPMGAMGLMQIMPGTARSPGFGVSPLKDPFDPDENKRFGTEYFNAMLKRYGGDQRKALVAYNWGPGNADKWNGDLSTLPKETREYVTRVEGFQGKKQPTYQPGGGGNVKRYQPGPLNQMQGVLAPGLRQQPRGLLDVPPEPQGGESFFTQDNVGSILDGLAGAFNTLRWRPDPAVSRGIEQRGARRAQAKRQNKTAEYLREAGAGQLAGLVETGALSARDAIGFLAAPEEEQTSMIQNFEYFVDRGMDPEAALAAIKGGTTVNLNTGGTPGERPIVDTPPKGFQRVYDEATKSYYDTPIPGGESYVDRETVRKKSVGQIDNMLDVVGGIKKDPQLGNALGFASFLPDIPGYNTSPRARLDQLQGQAFLQAYESLRGGGQITQIEGQKGEQAIARLRQSQTEAEYRAALIDLESVLASARKRLLGDDAENSPDDPLGLR